MTEWSEETAGCVITADGVFPFNDWFMTKYGEAPTFENVSRRASELEAKQRRSLDENKST